MGSLSRRPHGQPLSSASPGGRPASSWNRGSSISPLPPLTTLRVRAIRGQIKASLSFHSFSRWSLYPISSCSCSCRIPAFLSSWTTASRGLALADDAAFASLSSTTRAFLNGGLGREMFLLTRPASPPPSANKALGGAAVHLLSRRMPLNSAKESCSSSSCLSCPSSSLNSLLCIDQRRFRFRRGTCCRCGPFASPTHLLVLLLLNIEHDVRMR